MQFYEANPAGHIAQRRDRNIDPNFDQYEVTPDSILFRC